MNQLIDAQDLTPALPGSIARDPFALELVKNALVALADEMALTIYRTARSFVMMLPWTAATAAMIATIQLSVSKSPLSAFTDRYTADIQNTNITNRLAAQCPSNLLCWAVSCGDCGLRLS